MRLDSIPVLASLLALASCGAPGNSDASAGEAGDAAGEAGDVAGDAADDEQCPVPGPVTYDCDAAKPGDAGTCKKDAGARYGLECVRRTELHVPGLFGECIELCICRVFNDAARWECPL